MIIDNNLIISIIATLVTSGIGGLKIFVLTIPVMNANQKSMWAEFNRHRDDKGIHHESEKPIDDLKEDIRALQNRST